MPSTSNFPGGFPNGITIRNVPILQTNPGRVLWLSNNTVGLLTGQVGASDAANSGAFNRPFATLAYAISQFDPGTGGILLVKPGHAETISDATTNAANVAGVAIVGLGTGASRPTFTFATANTATIPVSANDISFQNCIFVANFLSIAAPFTLTTAKNFAVERCLFIDTSSILNFLNIVKTTGGANTADGLTFNDNVVVNLGVTSNNTTILTANTIDRLTMLRNNLKWAVQNDTAAGIIVTTGILTNLDFGYNQTYRPNTTTAGGSLINVGGTTSTGWVHHNYTQTLTTTSDLICTTTVGLGFFENYSTGVVGASGFIIPTRDS